MTRTLTLDKLHLDHPLWQNPRTVTGLSDKDLDELGDDLLDRGQRIPMLVQQIRSGENGEVIELVLDGQRRSLALQRAAKRRKKSASSIEVTVDDYIPSPVELTTESSDKMMLDALAIGIKRAGLSAFEQTEAALNLRSRHPEWTMEVIGKAIGRSESWVSRMIRARKLASPALCAAWSKGKVTDEQFKDLADVNPHDKQAEALADALGIREKGGRAAAGEARHKIKEASSTAKEKEKETREVKTSAASGRASSKNDGEEVVTKYGKTLQAKPQLRDIVRMAALKKPSDPYVKGLVHGAQFALGELETEEFSPAWRSYMKQVAKLAGNDEKPAKVAKPAKPKRAATKKKSK